MALERDAGRGNLELGLVWSMGSHALTPPLREKKKEERPGGRMCGCWLGQGGLCLVLAGIQIKRLRAGFDEKVAWS